ncbi:hypothetical protein [Flagellimonas sp.]|uniref:hypothetical protein n=1 Tax=Flagellimonas sp. TaxID=2058762 RepID=UPI003B59EE3F
MSQRKKPWGTYIFLGAILFSGFMFYMMSTSETSNGVVNLVLKKNNKVYVYSNMGSTIVQSSIAKRESPSTMAFIQMYEEDDKLYIAPNNVKDIVNLLCGNYQIHDYPEKSSDGYVTSGSSTCFESTYVNQTTKNIGEQVSVNTVKLTSENTGKTFNVISETNKRTFKSKALKNCYEKSFMIKTSVQPGEFVIASKDFIMVNLQDVVDFYGNKVTLTLNKEEQILYVEYL